MVGWGYQGGKARLGKPISEVINAYIEKNDLQNYVEPFFGCGGVTRRIRARRRVVSDMNGDLIKLWRELRDGTFTFPRSNQIKRSEFEEFKRQNREMVESKTRIKPSATRAMYGLLCSSPYRYMDTFLEMDFGRTQKVGAHVRDGLTKMQAAAQEYLSDVEFVLPGRSYDKLPRRKNWVIYADPPYFKTAGYHGTGQFDHEAFWRKAAEWAKQGNHVFVSYNRKPLYEARKWKLVWSKTFRGKGYERGEYLWFRALK